LAYVALTLWGGTEQARRQVQEALTSYFESGWGEVAVELTHDGAAWRIESAWSHPPGRHRENPNASAQDCRKSVAYALYAAGARVSQSRI
jgi:hypothetical protein